MVLRSRLIYLCILLLLVSGCGGKSAEIPPLTLTPPATLTVAGDCTLTSDMEGWLQAEEFRQQAFSDFIEGASGKSPEELYADVVQLNALLQTVSETPALDCVEEVHMQMVDAMQTTLRAFQAYINRDREDLATIIEESRRSFDEATISMNNLKTELERRLRGG